MSWSTIAPFQNARNVVRHPGFSVAHDTFHCAPVVDCSILITELKRLLPISLIFPNSHLGEETGNLWYLGTIIDVSLFSFPTCIIHINAAWGSLPIYFSSLYNQTALLNAVWRHYSIRKMRLLRSIHLLNSSIVPLIVQGQRAPAMLSMTWLKLTMYHR